MWTYLISLWFCKKKKNTAKEYREAIDSTGVKSVPQNTTPKAKDWGARVLFQTGTTLCAVKK